MSTASPEQPWLALPAEISKLLQPTLPALVEEIIGTIRQTVPAYTRPLEGRFGEAVRRGTEVALTSFLALPGTSRPALSAEARGVYAALGSGEVRQGRTLESLLAAYRAGTRVTLRRFSQTAIEADYQSEVLLAIGESVLAYIEEVSAASAEGFSFEQSERAGEVDRRRAEVVELLLLGQADEVAVQQAATAAGWSLAHHLVAILLPLGEAPAARFALGRRALSVDRATDTVVLAAAPATGKERRELERALRGRRAVIGPVREWSRVPDSLRLAVTATAVLVDETAAAFGDDELPLWVEEHLADIVLGAESAALVDMGVRRLGPLDGLRTGPQQRLTETLLAWLRHWGQRAPIAQELRIHPQTVGYRVAQLRQLFGAQLDDPQVRFEMELVLRARLGLNAG